MIRAKKGCRFAGKNYAKGEYVPEAAIDKKAIGALLQMKIIEITQDEIQTAIEATVEDIKPRVVKGRRSK